MQLVKDSKNVLHCDNDSITYVHDKSASSRIYRLVAVSVRWPTNSRMTYSLTNFGVLVKNFTPSRHNVKSGLEYNVFKVEGATLNRATQNFNLETFKKLILGETAQPFHQFEPLWKLVIQKPDIARKNSEDRRKTSFRNHLGQIHTVRFR